MNRRDMAKVVAAAAAGSVAGKAACDREHVDPTKVQKLFNSTLDLGHTAGYQQAKKEHQHAIRLQQAIELGDRTAEELDGWWSLHRYHPGSFTVLIYLRGASSIGKTDPDPLTAVEKARAAALSWKAEQ